MNMSSTADPPLVGGVRSTARRVLVAVVVAAVAAILGNLVIAAIAHAAGAPTDFPPLQPPAFIMLTVVGVIAGAVGWAVVRRRAADPAHLLTLLVPVVLLLSFVPDILVGVTRALPSTTWGAVFALMVMHVLVSAVAVTCFFYLLPLPARRH